MLYNQERDNYFIFCMISKKKNLTTTLQFVAEHQLSLLNTAKYNYILNKMDMFR